MFIRAYFLKPRYSKAAGRCGGVPASSSSISALIAADNTTYGGTTLQTNLQNSLFDSPSVVREYKIVRTTKWRFLKDGKSWKISQRATTPKMLDSGSDTLSTLWRYLPTNVIIVLEFKGFMGNDVAQIVETNTTAVPNTNNVLVAYNDTTTTAAVYQTDTVGNIPTHTNVASCMLSIRVYQRGDLKLESDETREIGYTVDTTPNGNKPYITRPLQVSVLAQV